MAAPSDLTINDLTIHALKLSGYTGVTAGDAVQLLAEDWFEDLKADIWHDSNKKLKSLMTENLFALTNGERKIVCPSDFARDIEIELLQGLHYGTVASGASASEFNLQSGEDASNSSSQGHEIVVYLTATKTTAYSSFITDITSETCQVSPDLPVTPSSSYSYIIVDDKRKLSQKHISQLGTVSRGTPEFYHPSGEIYDTNGSSKYAARQDVFYFQPVPYRTDSIPWAARHRYYADLLKLDLSDTVSTDIMIKFMREFRHVLTEGLKWKHYEYRDDDRRVESFQLYEALKSRTLTNETYGNEQINLQSVVVGDDDYNFPDRIL